MPNALVVPNAKLNYEIWGEENQRDIVLVNGHTRPLNDFRTLGKALVQQGWRVVAFDNRGSGLTSYEREFSLAEMVEDLRAITSNLTSGASVLLGISMGGMISMEYAAIYSESVRSLILISTTPHHRHFLSSLPAWPRGEDEILLELSRYVNSNFFSKNQVLMRSMAKQMAKSFANSPEKSAGAKWQRNSTKKFDCVEKLAAIKTPTTVVHGELDAVIDVAAARELSEHIPNIDLHILPGIGHLLLMEAFQELKEIVLRGAALEV